MNSTIQNSNKYIPLYFVAFFVFLAIAECIFIYIATSTHTGLVTKNPYTKGINYNETVEAFELQQKLDWYGDIIFRDTDLKFTLMDSHNSPIENAKVTAYFFYPPQDRKDFSVTLDELDRGNYAKIITFPAKGRWLVRINAIYKNENFQKSQYITVK